MVVSRWFEFPIQRKPFQIQRGTHPEAMQCRRQAMAVSVVPGSVLINVFEHPKVELPEAPLRGIKPFGPFAPAPVMAGFGCTQISMGGEVKLTGDEDEIAGCTLGFVQMQFVETFWCHYRGKTNTDGSMLIQRGLAPARQQQTCRDCLDKERSNIFLNVDELGKLDGPARPPVKLATGMEDQPNASALLGQLNSITNATNLLHEAQLERHFCAILTLQTPDGSFRHLATAIGICAGRPYSSPAISTSPSPKAGASDPSRREWARASERLSWERRATRALQSS